MHFIWFAFCKCFSDSSMLDVSFKTCWVLQDNAKKKKEGRAMFKTTEQLLLWINKKETILLTSRMAQNVSAPINALLDSCWVLVWTHTGRRRRAGGAAQLPLHHWSWLGERPMQKPHNQSRHRLWRSGLWHGWMDDLMLQHLQDIISLFFFFALLV